MIKVFPTKQSCFEKGLLWGLLCGTGAASVNHWSWNALLNGVGVGIEFFVIFSAIFLVERWWNIRQIRKAQARYGRFV